MMPFHQEIDTQKREYQHREADDGHNGGSPPAPPGRQSFMEQDRIKQPGDSGPNFFGIPAPEPAPERFRINEAGYQP